MSMRAVPLDPAFFGNDISKKDVVKSVETSWTCNTNGQEYKFLLALLENEGICRGKVVRGFAVEASSSKPPGEEKAAKRAKRTPVSVARLQAVLLDRGHRNFFEDADAISGGLQSMACAFFDSSGRNCRIDHPKLKKLGEKGFLFIDEVETRQSGLDLALHLLHAVLVLLRQDFEVAVIDAAPLSFRWCRYEQNVERAKASHERREKKDPQAQADREKAAMKIRRHFARMGFTQAVDTTNGWFLTSKEYFKDSTDVSKIPERWLSKEAAAKIEVEVTEQPPRSALDEELHEAVSQTLSAASTFGVSSAMIGASFGIQGTGGLQDGDVTKICDLVNRGASVDGAQAIHLAAANWKTPSLFHLLKSLGGDVNAADFTGRRPLHVAANTMNTTAARVLLELGADKMARDKKGKIPVESVEARAESMDDFLAAMGMRGNPMIAGRRAQEEASEREMRALLSG